MDNLLTKKQKSVLQELSVSLRNVDASTSYIAELSNSLLSYKLTQSKTFGSGLRLVCTGIYNAGKSSLLNSLLDKEVFEVGSIPTTKTVSSYSYDGIVYIDTPGLNATVSDDETTESIYREMDLMLFVSNIQNGGLTESEAKWLKKLIVYFGSPERLVNRTIFVLTNCYGSDYDDDKVVNKYCSDIKKIVGVNSISLMCVDSAVWKQGVQNKNTTLLSESNIQKLKEVLNLRVTEVREEIENDYSADRANAHAMLLDCCERIESFCQSNMQENDSTVAKSNFTNMIGKVGSEISTSIKKEYSFFECGPSYGSLGSVFLEGNSSSESGALKKAREKLYNFYNRCLDKYSSVAVSMSRKARQLYGSTGVGSVYYMISDCVNTKLEELYTTLRKDGYPISTIRKIEGNVDTSQVLDFIEKDMDNYRGYLPSYESYRNSHMEVTQIWEGTKEGFGGLFSWDVYSYSVSNFHELCFEIIKDFDKENSDLVSSLRTSVNFTYNDFISKVQSNVDTTLLQIRKEVYDEIERKYNVSIKPYIEIVDLVRELKGDIDEK